MNRFCPVCGRSTDELVDNLCRECFLKERDPVEVPERVTGTVCRGCMKHQRHGRWTRLTDDMEEFLRQVAAWEVERGIRTGDLAQVDVETKVCDIKETSPGRFVIPVEVRVTGMRRGVEMERAAGVEVEITGVMCPNCSRQAGSYYEAKIQVRGPGGKGVAPETLERITTDIGVMVERMGAEDGKGFLTMVKDLKEGRDFYLGSRKVARKIARNLQTTYGGDIKETATQAGQRDGKTLYRSTILLRLPKV
ncbi:MAG: hypothetical protein GXO65_04275 [Euryarchaeota archaeon]|nr:hypothetical protein [Euryarchaeota archaeon]